MCIVDAACPFPHGFRDRILERRGAGFYGNDLRPQQAHTIDIQSLADRILLAHKDDAFHIQQCRRGRRGNTVLPGSRLCDEAGFSHLFGKQRLPQHVVDLVRACVIQVLPFEVDLRTAQVPRHLLRVIQARGSARIVIQQRGQLPVKVRVRLEMIVGLFQFNDGVHQGFRDVLPAVNAKASVWVCHGVASCLSASRTARTNFSIFSGSFLPAVSIPELTSRPKGCSAAIAAAAFSEFSPPAST